MRLTILNQFFYPDHSATSQLMTELAQNLSEYGFEVTALASRGRYNGGGVLPPLEYYEGVRIERVRATSFGKTRLLGRLADYLSFYASAFWKLLTLPRQDVVMALTTPPLIGLIALVVGRLRGMRFVSLMEDLYPDVAVAVGALSHKSPLARLLDWLTRKMLQHADRIIVLSDCMLDRVVAKIGQEARPHIDVIHNWADGEEIAPLDDGKGDFFEELNWQDLNDKFVILFSGNLGLVNEFSTVLDAARALRARSDIVFVFIGEGSRAGEIKSFVSRHGLGNVRMLPYQPREKLRRSLASGDALLITLAEGLAGLSVPSKTYSSLAAGRPLLFVGDQRSCVARLIRKHDCGATVASGESERLAEIISGWADNRAEAAHLGASARLLFEQRFDRRVAVKGYVESLTRCLNGAGQIVGSLATEGMQIKAVDAKESIS
jgi:glycosyltransferase involved in cell wall biosynthesis